MVLSVMGPGGGLLRPGLLASQLRLNRRPTLPAATVLEQYRPRHRCTALAASSGDQLLHESLNREIRKLNQGTRRQADTPRPSPRPWRAAPRTIRPRLPSPAPAKSVQPGSRAPPLPRLLALLCLLPPLAAAIPYGSGLFVQFAFLRELLLRPMLPLVQAYYSTRLTSMFAIAALYGLVAKNRSLHPFTRAVGLQASTLMMMQFPAGFLLQFFVMTPGPVLNLVTGTVFAYFLYCIVKAALSCLRGSTYRLPLIGDGQQLPWNPRGGGFRYRPARGSS